MAVIQPKDLFAVYVPEVGVPLGYTSNTDLSSHNDSYDFGTGLSAEVTTTKYDDEDKGEGLLLSLDLVDGSLQTIANIIEGGTGYEVGDMVRVDGGTGGILDVMVVDPNTGAVQELSINDSGSDYQISSGVIFNLETTTTGNGDQLRVDLLIRGGNLVSINTSESQPGGFAAYTVGDEITITADTNPIVANVDAINSNSVTAGGVTKYSSDELKLDVLEWTDEGGAAFTVENIDFDESQGHDPGGLLIREGPDDEHVSKLIFQKANGKDKEDEIKLVRDYGQKLNGSGVEAAPNIDADGVDQNKLNVQLDLNKRIERRLGWIESNIYQPDASVFSNHTKPELVDGTEAFNNYDNDSRTDTSPVASYDDLEYLDEKIERNQSDLDDIKEELSSTGDDVQINDRLVVIVDDIATAGTDNNTVYFEGTEESGTYDFGDGDVPVTFIKYENVTKIKLCNKDEDGDGYDYAALKRHDIIRMRQPSIDEESFNTDYRLVEDPTNDGDFTLLEVIKDSTIFGITTDLYSSVDGDQSEVQIISVRDIDSGRYVNTTGDTMTGELILSGDPTNVSDANQAATKNYVDTRELDDLANVTAPSPSEGQTLTWQGGAWVPTGTNYTDLVFVKTLDATTTAPDANPVPGLLYIHDGPNGAAESNWGTLTLEDGDKLGYGNDNAWHKVGNVNNTTMDLASLSVTTGDAKDGGELSYNNSTGVFTFKPTDISALDNKYVLVTGDNMTGALTIKTSGSTDSRPMFAVKKDSTDDLLLSAMHYSAGDAVIYGGAMTRSDEIVTVGHVSNTYLPLAGGTMTGNINLNNKNLNNASTIKLNDKRIINVEFGAGGTLRYSNKTKLWWGSNSVKIGPSQDDFNNGNTDEIKLNMCGDVTGYDGGRIINMKDPVNAQDAVTLSYMEQYVTDNASGGSAAQATRDKLGTVKVIEGANNHESKNPIFIGTGGLLNCNIASTTSGKPGVVSVNGNYMTVDGNGHIRPKTASTSNLGIAKVSSISSGQSVVGISSDVLTVQESTNTSKGVNYKGICAISSGTPSSSSYQQGTMVYDRNNKTLYIKL